MSESITVRFTLPVSAREVYDAWLDGQQHSAMTGAKATASRSVDGEFTAWDGYIHGKNLLLIENQKIVQSWRSSEFPDEASDSVLSIRLTERHGLTEVELEHTDIPPGQSVQYQSGWIEFYANPMQKYFTAPKGKKATGAKKTRPVSKSQQVKKSTVKKVPKKPTGRVVSTPKRSGTAKKKVAKAKTKTGRVTAKGKK
ncbi:MAG: SRPBCC domain-containing protein [Turneriella sp.]